MILTSNKKLVNKELLLLLKEYKYTDLNLDENFIYVFDDSPKNIFNMKYEFGFFISQLHKPTSIELNNKEKFLSFIKLIMDELQNVDYIYLYNMIVNSYNHNTDVEMNDVYYEEIISSINDIPEDKFKFEYNTRYIFKLNEI